MAFISSRTPSTKLPFHRKFSTIEQLIVEVKFGKFDAVVGTYKTPKSIGEQYYGRRNGAKFNESKSLPTSTTNLKFNIFFLHQQ